MNVSITTSHLRVRWDASMTNVTLLQFLNLVFQLHTDHPQIFLRISSTQLL